MCILEKYIKKVLLHYCRKLLAFQILNTRLTTSIFHMVFHFSIWHATDTFFCHLINRNNQQTLSTPEEVLLPTKSSNWRPHLKPITLITFIPSNYHFFVRPSIFFRFPQRKITTARFLPLPAFLDI